MVTSIRQFSATKCSSFCKRQTTECTSIDLFSSERKWKPSWLIPKIKRHSIWKSKLKDSVISYENTVKRKRAHSALSDKREETCQCHLWLKKHLILKCCQMPLWKIQLDSHWETNLSLLPGTNPLTLVWTKIWTTKIWCWYKMNMEVLNQKEQTNKR